MSNSSRYGPSASTSAPGTRRSQWMRRTSAGMSASWLLTTVTSWPRATSSCSRCSPMYRLPPVTNALTPTSSSPSGQSDVPPPPPTDPAPLPHLGGIRLWAGFGPGSGTIPAQEQIPPRSRTSVDAGQDAQRTGGRREAEAAAGEGGQEDLLVRRAAAVGGVGEHVVDRQRAADRDVG